MRRVILALSLLGCGLAGCSQRPAWNDEPQAATLAYWIQEPATARVESGDYRALWDAADAERRGFGFVAALTDYRGGLLTTEPKVSPQFFEVWHRELRTAEDAAESSLATVRRRLRFEFADLGGGLYAVEPKVIVERLSLPERRITNAIDYRATLGPGQQQRFGPGSRQAARSYWYPIGRDADLERTMASRISGRVEGRLVGK